jgi:ribulose 1,5-bisphosphate synthetase/thiazole synthase
MNNSVNVVLHEQDRHLGGELTLGCVTLSTYIISIPSIKVLASIDVADGQIFIQAIQSP